MRTFTKTVLELEGSNSIERIKEELFFHTETPPTGDPDAEKRELVLLQTIQDLQRFVNAVDGARKMRD